MQAGPLTQMLSQDNQGDEWGQKGLEREATSPTAATSYPLAEQFLKQQGVTRQQEDPFDRSARSTSAKARSAALPQPLSLSACPTQPSLPGTLMHTPTLAVSNSAPAYPRAKELEHQRWLLQQKQHQQAKSHAPNRTPNRTPRLQQRRGDAEVGSTSRSASPKRALSQKDQKTRAESSPQGARPPSRCGPFRIARSPSTPRTITTKQPIKDEGSSRTVLVEPITSLSASRVPSPSTCRPKEVPVRNRSTSPLSRARPSPVQREKSVPAAAKQGVKQAPSPSLSLSRAPSPLSLATSKHQGKPKEKAKASAKSRGPSAPPAPPVPPAPTAQRPSSPQRPQRDASPTCERLPRKPAVPLAPRSQTPPKTSLASFLPAGQSAKPKSTAPSRTDFADKVAALPSQQAGQIPKRADETNGRVYMGFRDVQGQRSGYGVMQVGDGTTYTGQWCGSKREGYGTLFFKGGVFEGQWLQGSAHGKGAIHFQNGDTFEGTYAHNKKAGPGVYTWADGTKESGEYVAGQKDGTHLWCSGNESWEVVYEKGSLVATRRLESGPAQGAEADAKLLPPPQSTQAPEEQENEAPRQVPDKAPRRSAF